MKDKTTEKINQYCDRYGDKLIELMDRCDVTNLRDIPEEKALIFLQELEEGENR